MFGVGLHFLVFTTSSPCQWVAVPGALAQIVVATLMAAGLGHLWGWNLRFQPGLRPLLFPLQAPSCCLRALEFRNEIDTTYGRIAVGWLIVEDLAMVGVLVLLPALAEMVGSRAAASQVDGDLCARSPLRLPRSCYSSRLLHSSGPASSRGLLAQVARTGSRELFTLAVSGPRSRHRLRVGDAFGVSFALGAFFAGVILSESAASATGPRTIPCHSGRIRGPVLRLRRHAFRSVDPVARADPSRDDSSSDRCRKVARRFCHRAALADSRSRPR